MSTRTYTSYSRFITPQTEPMPGRESEQVENNAGGYVFIIDPWKALRRFLIIGSNSTYIRGDF